MEVVRERFQDSISHYEEFRVWKQDLEAGRWPPFRLEAKGARKMRAQKLKTRAGKKGSFILNVLTGNSGNEGPSLLSRESAKQYNLLGDAAAAAAAHSAATLTAPDGGSGGGGGGGGGVPSSVSPTPMLSSSFSSTGLEPLSERERENSYIDEDENNAATLADVTFRLQTMLTNVEAAIASFPTADSALLAQLRDAVSAAKK